MNSTRPHLPKHWKITLRIALLLLLVYVVFELTLRWAEPELEAKKVRIRALRAEVQALGERLEAASVRQRMAEREAEVMRQANNLLREQESERQEELQRLQGEVEFYQRLAGTSGAQDGLAVYHLELQATATEHVYHYVLTLTQNLQRSGVTSGTVEWHLQATRDGRPVTLSWRDLAEAGSDAPEFRFKYFQQLEGFLAIPPDVQPLQLTIRLMAKGSRNPIERSFEWFELTQPGGSPAPTPDPSDPGDPAASSPAPGQQANESTPGDTSGN